LSSDQLASVDDAGSDREEGTDRSAWLEKELDEAGAVVLGATLPLLVAEGTDPVVLRRIIALLRTVCLATSSGAVFAEICSAIAQATAKQNPKLQQSGTTAASADRGLRHSLTSEPTNDLLTQLARGSPMDLKATLGTSSDSEGEDDAEADGEAAPGSESDSESDWDSDSEDETGTDGTTPLLAELVSNLQMIAKKSRKAVDFEAIVAALPERHTLQWLLENNAANLD
jgi:hypothetical protein